MQVANNLRQVGPLILHPRRGSHIFPHGLRSPWWVEIQLFPISLRCLTWVASKHGASLLEGNQMDTSFRFCLRCLAKSTNPLTNLRFCMWIWLILTSSWSQCTWNILVNLDHFGRDGGESKRHLKPPSSKGKHGHIEMYWRDHKSHPSKCPPPNAY